MHIRIIVKRLQSGLNNDVETVADLYKLKFDNAKIEVVSYKDSNKKIKGRADHCVFIEHLPKDIGTWTGKYNIWIPNQEFLYEEDFANVKDMNMIWCKTQHGFNVISDYIGKYISEDLSKKCVYIGFYTVVNMGNMVPLAVERKDPKFAVHFAGSSFLKGTYEVLEAWLQAKTDVELCICMNNSQVANMFEKDRIFRKWDSLESKQILKYRGVNAKFWQYKNIVFCADLLQDDTYWKFMNEALWHVMPSKAEGFGHSINISRILGGLIITTDAAPMNELVTSETGILVEVESKTKVYKSIINWIPKEVEEYTNNISIKALINIIENLDKGVSKEKSQLIMLKSESDKKECIERFKRAI